jgi:hypothetical protein
MRDKESGDHPIYLVRYTRSKAAPHSTPLRKIAAMSAGDLVRELRSVISVERGDK